jgi:hypothetical protein
MSDNVWKVGTRNGEVKVVSSRPKLAHRPPFDINDKMPKNQVPFASGWNEMRERLILLGEMESK